MGIRQPFYEIQYKEDLIYMYSKQPDSDTICTIVLFKIQLICIDKMLLY